MGLKDLWNKGKCLVGLHDGEWKAVAPTRCDFTRTCVRCHVTQQKTEHTWGTWQFVTADACYEMRACPRCRLHEQRVTHAWAAPAYVADGACEQQAVCTRCRATQPAAVKHVLDAWRYLADDECAQVQQCSRCRADGRTQREAHTWGEWQHSNTHNGPVRVCRRCGTLEARPVAAAEPSNTAAQSFAGATTSAASQPAAASDAAPARDAAAPRDAQLVGHWRFTETLGGGGFSSVTDYHFVLDADGRFRRWSHSAGSLGESHSEQLLGTWRAAGGTLMLDYDLGGHSTMAYTRHEQHLYFPHSEQKLWERVR